MNPNARRRTEKLTAFAYLATLAAVGLLWTYTFQRVRKMQSIYRSSADTQEMHIHASEMLSKMQKVEMAVLAYVLTGNESFVKEYPSDTNTIQIELAKVLRIQTDCPDQQLDAQSLKTKAHDRLAFLSHMLATRRSAGMDPMAESLARDNAEAIVKRMRNDDVESQLAEIALAKIGAAKSMAADQLMFEVVGIGGLLGLTVLLGLMILLKRAKDANREANEKSHRLAIYNRTLLEASLDPLVTISVDGKITDVNEATVQTTGRMRDQLVGTNFADYFSEPAKASKGYQRVISEGLVRDYPLAILHADGHVTEVLYNASLYRDEQGAVCGVFAAARDITERKEAESQLQKLNQELEQRVMERTKSLAQSEERWRYVLEASHTGAWEMDLKTHKAFRSVEHDRIFGYPELLPEWTSERFLEHVLPEDRAKVSDALLYAGESNSEWNFECRIRRIDGRTRWVLIIGRSCKVTEETPHHIAGIIQDITQRKQAEEERIDLIQNLSRRTAELLAMNKELEAFSYSVSHDLRAPLRSIDGFSRILMEDYQTKLDDEGRDNLARVRAASQRMGQLIDGMLQLSRLSRCELSLERVNLSEIARDVVDGLQKVEPERRVEVMIEANLLAFAGAALMRSLLENLLGNAWKFTRKTGNAKITFGLTTHEKAPTFFVRDNGAGFDMTYAHKLFGAFQRLHAIDEFPGTGVGLATVQRVIVRHGGRVWADSKPDQGATFYFTLPDPYNPNK